jgi:transcription antitermination factor NusG
MSFTWHVMHSKPHKEGFLAEQLELRQVETFAPRIRVQVVNPRARKIRPYFPGYLFVHLDLEATGLTAIQYIPGSHGLVKFGDEAAYVPDALILAIRRRVDEINAAGGELLDAMRPGDVVVIHSGPFTGYEAIFDARLPGTERVRVLLKLLRAQQMRVELPAGQLSLKKRSSLGSR